MLAPGCSMITITGALFAFLIIADSRCMRQAQRCMTSAYAISLAELKGEELWHHAGLGLWSDANQDL